MTPDDIDATNDEVAALFFRSLRVRLLLDTHVGLWAITYDQRLSERARGLLTDGGNEIFISAASVWEIAVQHALSRGRRNDIVSSGRDALTRFAEAGFALLAISPAHAAEVIHYRSCMPTHSTDCCWPKRSPNRSAC